MNVSSVSTSDYITLNYINLADAFIQSNLQFKEAFKFPRSIQEC